MSTILSSSSMILPFPEPSARPAPRAELGQIVLRMLMIFGLYAMPVFGALQMRIDWDLWWHLRVGQWVVEHGVPTTDPFSAPQDKPWVAYSWLFEVLIYGLYRAFGLVGATVYSCAMSLAVVAALHRLIARRQPHFLLATALTAVATLAVAMLFQQRPWLFTILFTTMTLDAVLCLREGRRPPIVWLLPVVFLIWANVHIQFVYGLGILGLACVAPLADRLAKWPTREHSACRAGSRLWWHLVIVSAACFLTTFVNPYHWRLYAVVVEYAAQPGPFRFVNELKALEFREPCDWVMLALFGCGTFALGRRKQLSTFDILLMTAAAILAFRARRDLWFVVVVASAILATAGPAVVAEEARFRLSMAGSWVLAGAVAGLILAVGWWRGLTDQNLQTAVAEVFPVRAAAVVRERGYEGPLYNDFNWGGYLIWALPEHRVVLDGRTNLHGDERIERIGASWAGSDSWRDDPDLRAANVIVAENKNPLTDILTHETAFERVYVDELSSVFVRRR